MHSLLKRQIAKFYPHPDKIPAACEAFIAAVNSAYQEADADRKMLERSLELSSQELLESNTEMRALFAAMNDVVIVLDGDGRYLKIVDTNPGLLFKPAHELLGKTLHEIMPNEKADYFVSQIRQTLNTHQRRTFQYKLPIGERNVWFEASISPLSKNKVMWIASDINQEKLAEEALRDSEEGYRMLFESNPYPIWVHDVETLRFMAVNNAAVNHYGYSSEEFLSMTVKDIQSSADADMQLVAEEQSRASIDSRGIRSHRKKDGTVIQVEITSHGIVFGGREARLVLAIDVTARESAEERIRQQAALLDMAQDAIYVQDLDGTITFWNHGASNIYGWTPEEATGMNADPLLCTEGMQFKLPLRTVLGRGDWVGELNQRAKDGRSIIVQSRYSLVRDKDGEPRSVLVINTDITEKKSLETQFLRSQRLESIGTLAGGIAHDLNNVLAPILLAVPVLRSSPGEELTKKVLDGIEASATRGASIVKQVLSFARGEASTRAPLNPRHLIAEVEKLMKNTFPKSIQVESRIAGNLWTITGDGTQLYQALMNLCVNARDAMPDGGILRLGAENVILDEQYTRMHVDAKPGPHLVLSVSDTGIGIPPNILDKIFEPFFTTKDVGRGTGLGLSTVIGIVKNHEGFVNVYSEVGKGTCFKAYFPALPADETEHIESEQLTTLKGRGELVLVVDDEEAIRDIQKTTLEANGYRVLTAVDGTEAVATYVRTNGGIKIVITDIMMPFMDGIATVRALRKLDSGLKFIVTSGLLGDHKIAELAPENAITFLQKPFTSHQLLTTVTSMLDKS